MKVRLPWCCSVHSGYFIFICWNRDPMIILCLQRLEASVDILLQLSWETCKVGTKDISSAFPKSTWFLWLRMSHGNGSKDAEGNKGNIRKPAHCDHTHIGFSTITPFTSNIVLHFCRESILHKVFMVRSHIQHDWEYSLAFKFLWTFLGLMVLGQIVWLFVCSYLCKRFRTQLL